MLLLITTNTGINIFKNIWMIFSRRFLDLEDFLRLFFVFIGPNLINAIQGIDIIQKTVKMCRMLLILPRVLVSPK